MELNLIIRALIPFMRTVPCDLMTSQRPQFLIPLYWELEFQYMNLRGHGNIQFFAYTSVNSQVRPMAHTFLLVLDPGVLCYCFSESYYISTCISQRHLKLHSLRANSWSPSLWEPLPDSGLIFWFPVYKCSKCTRKILLHKYFYVKIFWFNIHGNNISTHRNQKYVFFP